MRIDPAQLVPILWKQVKSRLIAALDVTSLSVQLSSHTVVRDNGLASQRNINFTISVLLHYRAWIEGPGAHTSVSASAGSRANSTRKIRSVFTKGVWVWGPSRFPIVPILGRHCIVERLTIRQAGAGAEARGARGRRSGNSAARLAGSV